VDPSSPGWRRRPAAARRTRGSGRATRPGRAPRRARRPRGTGPAPPRSGGPEPSGHQKVRTWLTPRIAGPFADVADPRMRGDETMADQPRWRVYFAEGAPPDGGGRLRLLRRAGEVEAELLLLGEVDELPHVGEGAAVAVAELIEDDAAGLADAGRHLQQL